jgi:hypothetical protein
MIGKIQFTTLKNNYIQKIDKDGLLYYIPVERDTNIKKE